MARQAMSLSCWTYKDQFGKQAQLKLIGIYLLIESQLPTTVQI